MNSLVGWALLRGVAVAVLALAIAFPLRRALARSGFTGWALLFAPWLTPALLVSYAYARFAHGLGDLQREFFYTAALLFRLVPIATVTVHLLPRSLSAEGAHCHELLARPGLCQRMLFRTRGAGPAPWVALALVSLLAFSDFELAALWNINTWSVHLFDAHSGGLALRDSLQLAVAPMLCAAALLVPLWFLAREVPGPAPVASAPVADRRGAFVYLAFAAGAMTLWPLARVAAQAVASLPSLGENFALARATGSALLFAAVSAMCAFKLSAWLRCRRPVALLLSGPGLLGGLVVSLLVLALFQRPGLRLLYDTPLPLVLALTILLLPIALFLQAFLNAATPSLHIARMLRARTLIWHLHTRRRFTAAAILFCCAYFDFTASSLLAPVDMTTVFTHLHNLAHYGQTAVLSAMLCVALVAPIAALGIGATVARILATRG